MTKMKIVAAWWEIQARMLYKRIRHQLEILERKYPESRVSVIIQPFTERKVAMWLLVEGKEQVNLASRQQILRQSKGKEDLKQCFCLKKTYTIWNQMMPVMEITEEIMEERGTEPSITMYSDLQTIRDFMISKKKVSPYNFMWEFC